MTTSFFHKGVVAITTLFFAQFANIYGQEGKQMQPKKNLINFEEKLTWQEILQKAKKESKYIFLDCYTTWCGPCKRLDAEVYTDSSVASALNKDFINVKMQMDKTGADADAIKARYKDASFIDRNYNITAYPTLILFNPNGEVTVKHTGFLRAGKLIDSAATAKLPGRIYYDAEKELNVAIEKYQQGHAGILKLKHLIDMANVARKKKVEDSLKQQFLDIARTLDTKEVYQPEVLAVISNSTLKENDPLLGLFYPDGTKADAVAGRGFSQFVVDKYIRKTYFEKVVYNKNSSLNSVDSAAENIGNRFSNDYKDRGTLAAKLQWASVRQKSEFVLIYVLKILYKYGEDAMSIYGYKLPSDRLFSEIKETVGFSMNAICWELFFLKSSSEESLDLGINMMEKIVAEKKHNSAILNGYALDTYANLLYKRGDVNEAIRCQKEAVAFCRTNLEMLGEAYCTELEKSLSKMKSGIPTWPQPK